MFRGHRKFEFFHEFLTILFTVSWPSLSMINCAYLIPTLLFSLFVSLQCSNDVFRNCSNHFFLSSLSSWRVILTQFKLDSPADVECLLVIMWSFNFVWKTGFGSLCSRKGKTQKPYYFAVFHLFLASLPSL